MKKIFAVLLAVAMVLAMAACSGNKGPAKTYDVTIWVSEVEGVKELTLQQVEAFNKANSDIQINATVEGVSEANSATQMLTDVETGADIYCFAQDQLARLIQAGALAKLGEGTAKKVKDENSAASVSCATFGDVLYAFPITDDNGYFMYYDKSVVSDDKVDSLEDLIKVCEDNNKLFSFNLEGSAWYAASFFFATGCVSDWTTDSEGNFIEVNDTFNSEAGLIALEGMQKLVKSKCFNSSESASDFSASSAVVVSGTWDYKNAKAALGDNFGVADLPSFTVGGKSYHLGSFNGCKLMGMKPQSDTAKAAAVQRLAYYLAGEECQMGRFDAKGWGPSNKKVAASDKVASDPTLVALAAQNAYAKPQGQIHGSWWDIGKAIATNLKAGDGSAAARQAVLDAYKDSMTALFNMSEDDKNAFSVIGGFEGSGWNTDIDMKKVTVDGTVETWKTDKAITFNANDELKIRQGHSWDNALGATNPGTLSSNDGNFVVTEAGDWFVVFVYNSADNTGTISLSAN
jgi:arabinogalactan oligomer/maltooligosaccharide transport system substrate-binding protein